MILAKARLIESGSTRVRVGLSFPTGFDPEEVVQETVRGNESVEPEAVRVDPRRGNLADIYREFEVSFRSEHLSKTNGQPDVLRITGKLRRGLRFTASLTGISSHNDTGH